MISIVICSVNPVYLAQVEENIAATIGVPYELLVWDNSQAVKGICEVYNNMAEKAGYEYICFAHEDILFQTMNWGRVVSSVFSEQPAIGVLGVAGSKYKSRCFSGWYTGIKEFDCANIIHRFSWGDEHILLKPSANRSLEEVVCVDGVLIISRKEVWQQIRFDEEHLRGFHFYDIDFSTRAAAVCKVAVTLDILTVHITKGGDFGNNWVETAIAYHELHQQRFPLFTGNELPAGADKKVIRTWLDLLKNFHISWRNKWKWLSSQKLLVKPVFFYPVTKFLFYKPLGLRAIHKPARRK